MVRRRAHRERAAGGGRRRILDAARKLKKQADNTRKEEKEPHAQAAKAVEEAWRPVLADADRIAECAKKAQTKWLIKLDAEKRAAEEQARKEAEAKIAEAQRLAAEADGSLAAAKARDEAIKDAQRAERAVSRAHTRRPPPRAKAWRAPLGCARSIAPQVDDRRALLNHIAATDPASLIAFVEDWAGKMVRTGKRVIPGVTVIEDQVAA
jgi:hypothetical protein